MGVLEAAAHPHAALFLDARSRGRPPRILRAFRGRACPRLRGWRAIMSGRLLDTVERHKSGEAVGIYSVCSAHPLVIEASVLQALDDDGYLLVEATSNQVDQFGGYTGMRPRISETRIGPGERHGLPEDRIVLGGDHLGPNRWQEHPAEEAWPTREISLLPTSLLDSPSSISTVACPAQTTAARWMIRWLPNGQRRSLAGRSRKCQPALRHRRGPCLRSWDGGTRAWRGPRALERLTPTSADAARATLAAHEDAFSTEGLEEAWNRVIALVVQPGVEFDLERVIDYERSATGELRRVLDDRGRLVFEAHSTDYQTRANLRALVEDHWAVLKVGPALTFAMREALFALAAIEDELVAEGDRSELLSVVEHRMQEEPGYWEGYYSGGPVANICYAVTATATGSATTGRIPTSRMQGSACFPTWRPARYHRPC